MGCAPRFHELISTDAAVIKWTSIGVSVAGVGKSNGSKIQMILKLFLPFQLFGVILSWWISKQHNAQKEFGISDIDSRKF